MQMRPIQRFSQWIVRVIRARHAGSERVLVISTETHELVERFCRRLEWKLTYAFDFQTALAILQDQSFEVIIYDQDLPHQDWRSAVTSLATTAPWSSILLLSPLGYPALWNEVIRRGGHDILYKPISEAAGSVVALAMTRAKLRSSLDRRRIGKRNMNKRRIATV
jgi:DNA-binding response OmpR family regulator